VRLARLVSGLQSHYADQHAKNKRSRAARVSRDITAQDLPARERTPGPGLEPDYHVLAAWCLLGFATLHAAAAMRHHYVRRDAVLAAMLPRPPWRSHPQH